jgi:hypothetical protein
MFSQSKILAIKFIPSKKQEMEMIPVDITIAKYAGCKFFAIEIMPDET